MAAKKAAQKKPAVSGKSAKSGGRKSEDAAAPAEAATGRAKPTGRAKRKPAKTSAGGKASGARRKLVLFDGTNTVYRAFFAIPHLRAPDGSPTNAAYGFLNTLSKVIREEAPDYVAVAWDPRGGTFRHEIYGEYKAGRDAQPEDLSSQIPLVRELVEAQRVPLVEVAGFEADDVIATCVAETSDDIDVVIVSSDKDLMQLVSERVTLVDGIKDKRIGPAEVEERFGVPPERILDLRALVGDPSDNIPGVKGIGEKGAAKLLDEFGTLEALLENAADVKAKRAREALLERADDARLSKLLATLRSDVPVPPLEAFARQEPDPEVLREMYTRLGFTRLLDALGAGDGEVPTVGEERSVETRVVSGAAQLGEIVKAITEADEAVALCAIFDGGTAVDAHGIGIAVALAADRAAFIPVSDGVVADAPLFASANGAALDAREVCAALAGALGESKHGWLAAASKQTQSFFAEREAELPLPAADIELAGFLLDPAAASDVPALAQRFLGDALPSWEDLAGRGAKATPAAELPTDKLAAWAGAHACAAARLWPELRSALDADGLAPLYDDVELPLTRVLSRVERAGVRIDEARLAALSVDYEAQLGQIEGEIYELAGEKFLVNSPKQLQVILFEKLKLPVVKKTKTGYSTAEDVLEQLALEHELPGKILAWRRLSKLKSTYLDALPPLVSRHSGRLHPTFLQTGAATGRLASTRPNVQNIPIRTEDGIRIREAFIPAEGCRLVSADYSQVELRILAHYSQDASLIEAFTRGEDIHRRTAAEVAGISPDEVTPDQRARAKAVNFGIIYGSSAFGLANQLGIAQAEAKQTIDAYFARYDGVRRFLDETTATAKQQGYVTTLLGRRRYLPDLNSRNRVLRQAAERMAVNTVIQGSEADLIKRAMVELDEALLAEGLAARMILQVHDELVFEAPKREIPALTELARQRMRDVYPLRVPLEVDIGEGANWREAH